MVAVVTPDTDLVVSTTNQQRGIADSYFTMQYAQELAFYGTPLNREPEAFLTLCGWTKDSNGDFIIPDDANNDERLSRERKGRAVVRYATRTLDQQCAWDGTKRYPPLSATQSLGQRLEFPRIFLYDRDGYWAGTTDIPLRIREAYAHWTFLLALEPDRMREVTEPGHLGQKKVTAGGSGGVSVEYDNADRPAAVPSWIRKLLNPYVEAWDLAGGVRSKWRRG